MNLIIIKIKCITIDIIYTLYFAKIPKPWFTMVYAQLK